MAFDNIHNYYEDLVLKKIIEITQQHPSDENADFLEDVACVALNHLPPRYVRHNVDIVYYMTSDERNRMLEQIENAVTYAIEYVMSHSKRTGNAEN
ncbi:MAG: late competence development ComFB family protein [Gammaproteobacteria bacterium]|nr:late competence development ComFB family protein [Gammaproteobacteria bacterium]MDH5652458.1 late competence development ComFB family protein [Gammaproteobacteria bacterium]